MWSFLMPLRRMVANVPKKVDKQMMTNPPSLAPGRPLIGCSRQNLAFAYFLCILCIQQVDCYASVPPPLPLSLKSASSREYILIDHSKDSLWNSLLRVEVIFKKSSKNSYNFMRLIKWIIFLISKWLMEGVSNRKDRKSRQLLNTFFK